jgi:hypothetical protein
MHGSLLTEGLLARVSCLKWALQPAGDQLPLDLPVGKSFSNCLRYRSGVQRCTSRPSMERS